MIDHDDIRHLTRALETCDTHAVRIAILRTIAEWAGQERERLLSREIRETRDAGALRASNRYPGIGDTGG